MMQQFETMQQLETMQQTQNKTANKIKYPSDPKRAVGGRSAIEWLLPIYF
jgi:hypothetical protein